jgi:hypothetical protein
MGADVFYKLLGVLVWKAGRYYVRRKVPTKKLAAAAVVTVVAAVGVGAALRQGDDA